MDGGEARDLYLTIQAEVTVATWLDPKWKEQIKNNNTATRHSDWIQRTLNSTSHRFIMSDNKKQEKDFTSEVDVLLPEAEAVVKVRSLCSLVLFTLSTHPCLVGQAPGSA